MRDGPYLTLLTCLHATSRYEPLTAAPGAPKWSPCRLLSWPKLAKLQCPSRIRFWPNKTTHLSRFSQAVVTQTSRAHCTRLDLHNPASSKQNQVPTYHSQGGQSQPHCWLWDEKKIRNSNLEKNLIQWRKSKVDSSRSVAGVDWSSTSSSVKSSATKSKPGTKDLRFWSCSIFVCKWNSIVSFAYFKVFQERL